MGNVDNTKASQNEEVEITDSMLDDAFRAAEEVKVDEPEEKELENEEGKEATEEVVEESEEVVAEAPKEVPEVKDDENAERSRLGRKVANLERTLMTFVDEMRQMQYANTVKPPKTESVEEPIEEDDIHRFVTVKDLDQTVEKVLTTRAQKAEAYQRAYQNSYITSMVDLTKDLDDDILDEVLAELDKPQKNNTGNPVIDAKLNYLEAHKEVLSRKISKKVSPLQKNVGKETKGLALNGQTKVESKKSKVPTLDAEAMEFIRRSGLTPEEVEEALTGESPTLVTLSKGMDMRK